MNSKIIKVVEPISQVRLITEYIFKLKNPPKPVMLGRWKRDYPNIPSKVDLANEDNCGICNEYLKSKLNNKK